MIDGTVSGPPRDQNAAWVDLGSADRRFLFVATVAYAVLAAIMLAGSVPLMTLVQEDALKFYAIAQEMLDPAAQVSASRQPLFPLIVAGSMALGSNGAVAAAGFNLVFLWLTALFAYAAARRFLPKGAPLVFVLVLFNPAALGMAFLMIADILFAMLLAAALYGAVAYAIGPSARLGVLIGGLVGAAAMTRPEAKYLVWLLPLAVPLMGAIGGLGAPLMRMVMHGALALVCALVVCLPWMTYLGSQGYGYKISAGLGATLYLKNQISVLESTKRQIRYEDAHPLVMAESEKALEAAGLANAPSSETGPFLQSHYLRSIGDYSPKVLTVAWLRAMVAMYASGGAQTVNSVLGLEFERPDKFLTQGNGVTTFINTLAANAPLPAGITVFAITFALFARVLGLVGLVAMVVRRHWTLLVPCLALVAFITAVHMFIGLARYRLAVEPALMILAVYGLSALRPKWFASDPPSQRD